MASFHLIVYFLIILSGVLGQTVSPSAPTCSNSNLQMTPNLRQKVLDAMNTARQTFKNEQVLLINGQNALPPAEMPDLVWDCQKEEEIHQYLKGQCDAPVPPVGTLPDLTLNPTPFLSWMHFGYDVADYDAFLEIGLSYQFQYGGPFGLSSSVFLARSPVYTGIQRLDIYNSNASTVGCAMYDCDIATKYGNGYLGNFTTQIMCSVDPKVQFGEEIYEVASSATNYIPPSEDVICQDGIFVIQHREMIMTKINEIRSKIADGTYELENGEIALKALSLNNLVWSCDEEAAMGAKLSSLSCDNTLYDLATEFHKIIHQTTMWINIDDINGFIDQLINEFFVSNSNFNFLSTSSTCSTPYPAAFALSDQATSFACNAKACYQNGSID